MKQTPERNAAVVRMRAGGASLAEIRAEFGLSVGQVNGILWRHDHPCRARAAQKEPCAPRAPRTWTAEMLERVRQAAEGDLPMREVAAALGMTHGALSTGCSRHGIHWRVTQWDAKRAQREAAAAAIRAEKQARQDAQRAQQRRERQEQRQQRREEARQQREADRQAKLARRAIAKLPLGKRAEAELRLEIAAAKAEANTAPLYRGGWPA